MSVRSKMRAAILVVFLSLVPAAPAAAAGEPAVPWTRSDGSWVHQHTTRYRVLDRSTGAWPGRVAQALRWWDERTVLKVSSVTDPSLANVTVDSGNYGDTGWAGLAYSGVHVAIGSTLLNDYYVPGSSEAFLQAVPCQELGHDFGLSHGGNDCMSSGYHTPWTPDPQAGNVNLLASSVASHFAAPNLTLSAPARVDQGDDVAVTIEADDAADRGRIVSYTTRFPDRTDSGSGAPGSRVLRGLAVGSYSVSSTVVDDDDHSTSRSASFTVVNVPPALDITGPAALDSGAAARWALVASDRSGITPDVSWTLRRQSDGATLARGTGPVADLASAPAPGAYELVASAIDQHGAQTDRRLSVTVEDPLPNARITGPAAVANDDGRVTTNVEETFGLADVTHAEHLRSVTWTAHRPDGVTTPATRPAGQSATFQFVVFGRHEIIATLESDSGAKRVITMVQNVEPANLALDLDAEPRVGAGRTIDVRITVTGVGGGTPVTLNLVDERGAVRDTRTVQLTTAPEGGTAQATSTVTLPSAPGTYVLAATLQAADGQTVTREVVWSVDPPPAAATAEPPTTGRVPATAVTSSGVDMGRLPLRVTVRVASRSTRSVRFVARASGPVASYRWNVGCGRRARVRVTRTGTLVVRAAATATVRVCVTAVPKAGGQHATGRARVVAGPRP